MQSNIYIYNSLHAKILMTVGEVGSVRNLYYSTVPINALIVPPFIVS